MPHSKDRDRVQAGKKAAAGRERDEHGHFISEDEKSSAKSAAAQKSQGSSASSQKSHGTAAQSAAAQGRERDEHGRFIPEDEEPARRPQQAHKAQPKAHATSAKSGVHAGETRERDEHGRFISEEEEESPKMSGTAQKPAPKPQPQPQAQQAAKPQPQAQKPQPRPQQTAGSQPARAVPSQPRAPSAEIPKREGKWVYEEDDDKRSSKGGQGQPERDEHGRFIKDDE